MYHSPVLTSIATDHLKGKVKGRVKVKVKVKGKVNLVKESSADK